MNFYLVKEGKIKNCSFPPLFGLKPPLPNTLTLSKNSKFVRITTKKSIQKRFKVAKKEYFGLSFPIEAMNFVLAYAETKNISRSEAIYQIFSKGQMNIEKVEYLERERIKSNDKLLKEVEQLKSLLIQLTKKIATIEAYDTFILENYLHVDIDTIQHIREIANKKFLESLNNG